MLAVLTTINEGDACNFSARIFPPGEPVPKPEDPFDSRQLSVTGNCSILDLLESEEQENAAKVAYDTYWQAGGRSDGGNPLPTWEVLIAQAEKQLGEDAGEEDRKLQSKSADALKGWREVGRLLAINLAKLDILPSGEKPSGQAGEDAQPLSFQDRVRKEDQELAGNLQRLQAFFDTDTFARLDPREQDRLRRQAGHMAEYSRVLDERIQAFADPNFERPKPAETLTRNADENREGIAFVTAGVEQALHRGRLARKHGAGDLLDRYRRKAEARNNALVALGAKPIALDFEGEPSETVLNSSPLDAGWKGTEIGGKPTEGLELAQTAGGRGFTSKANGDSLAAKQAQGDSFVPMPTVGGVSAPVTTGAGTIQDPSGRTQSADHASPTPTPAPAPPAEPAPAPAAADENGDNVEAKQ